MKKIHMVRQIALDLIQVVGLMLPVVFLTMRFVQRNTTSKTSKQTESVFLALFLLMLGALTVSGVLLLLGILDVEWASWLVFSGIVSMIAFFILFGMFIFYFIRYMKPEYKRHIL